MNVSSIKQNDESQLATIVVGDDTVGDYLHRLKLGQLSGIEQRAGASRKLKLGESNHKTDLLESDEYPDENMPND